LVEILAAAAFDQVGRGAGQALEARHGNHGDDRITRGKKWGKVYVSPDSRVFRGQGVPQRK
jgi:hypothetical protein